MRISDWSSDVCSSDLHVDVDRPAPDVHVALPGGILQFFAGGDLLGMLEQVAQDLELDGTEVDITTTAADPIGDQVHLEVGKVHDARSEEHTSELQSLMRISYAVFCLKKKKRLQNYT